MKQYWSFFKLRFAAGLQYRAAALAGVLTQLFFGLVFISVYIAFYSNGEGNTSINLQEITTYLWLNQMLYSLIFVWYKDQELQKLISNGNIAYELCRPQNIYIMWFTRILSAKLSSVLLRSIPLLVIIIFLPAPYAMSAPVSLYAFIMFVISLIISSLLVTSLIVLVYVISCYTIDEKGIVNIYYSIAEILSGQIVPLPLFPKLLGIVSSFLPFAYVSDFAFRIYCGNIMGMDIIKGLLIQISWLFIIFILGQIITNKILKRVVVQGG